MTGTSDTVSGATAPNAGYVWDRFVRIFHWSLVAGFAIAFLTEDDVLILHVWAGYLVGALIVMRLVWGVLGPRHARFSDFVCRPRTVAGYLGDLLSLRAKRYLGHSPAGGAMILALLAVVALTVVTGIAADTGTGDASARALPAATRALASSDEDRERREGREKEGNGGVLGEMHEAVANLALILVFVHVAGVGFASLVHRENLVRAMITGWKRA